MMMKDNQDSLKTLKDHNDEATKRICRNTTATKSRMTSLILGFDKLQQFLVPSAIPRQFKVPHDITWLDFCTNSIRIV